MKESWSECVSAFMDCVATIVSGELGSVPPSDPPPWKERLVSAGMSAEELEDASFVLAALADECPGSDPLAWASADSGGWTWLLFRESNAGEQFFVRCQLAKQGHARAVLLYWIGIRAGFQGRFIGELEALQAWVSEQGLGELSSSLPPLCPQPLRDGGRTPQRRRPWWIPWLALCACLSFYRALAAWAQGMAQ